MDCTNKRIEWIDTAKGITILLVIIAHTVYYGNTGSIIHTVIYSFHMPLFFILSGFTATLTSTKEDFLIKTKKLAMSLLVPAYVAYICKLFICMVIDKPDNINFNFFINHLYSMLYVSKGKINNQQDLIYLFGYIWFLVVLFLCRTLLNYLNLLLNREQLIFVTSLLSLIGYAIGIQTYMIFSFDIVLTVLPFFLCGQFIKRINISKAPFMYGICSFLIWITGLFLMHPHPRNTEHLDFFARKYPFYPLCFFTAITGSVFLCTCCIILSKLHISKFFALIGKHSLILLLIHYFDSIWKTIWISPSDQYIRVLLRLLMDIAIFLLIILVRILINIVKKRTTKLVPLKDNNL
ncbi:MAG: acyltransferase family protein [Lachnospiraceae bacterium]|nr:acyltransferase family protein [Lachnospiraceae bacterium]